VVNDGPLLLHIRDGSVQYGIPISTLYQWAASGVPGFVRRGRSVRIHREIFEQWLENLARGGNDDYAA